MIRRFLLVLPLYAAGSVLLFVVLALLLSGGDALVLWLSLVAVPWRDLGHWSVWHTLDPSAVLQWGFRLTRPLLAAYESSRSAGQMFEALNLGALVLCCVLSWGFIVCGLVSASLDVVKALLRLFMTGRGRREWASILWPLARLGLLIVLLNAGVPMVEQLAGVEAPSTLERHTLTVAPIVLAMLVYCLGGIGQKSLGEEPQEEMAR
jgi:hypothetical protein